MPSLQSSSSLIIDSLNQVLRLLCRGLPAYVSEIKPWTDSRHEPIRKALADLSADQERYAHRLANAIVQQGGHPDPGSFPLEYTGLNDVSLEYLAHDLVVMLQADAEVLEILSDQLADHHSMHALCEEILGNTKGHAEILEKVVGG